MLFEQFEVEVLQVYLQLLLGWAAGLIEFLLLLLFGLVLGRLGALGWRFDLLFYHKEVGL